jgi:hypothetical protein
MPTAQVLQTCVKKVVKMSHSSGALQGLGGPRGGVRGAGTHATRYAAACAAAPPMQRSGTAAGISLGRRRRACGPSRASRPPRVLPPDHSRAGAHTERAPVVRKLLCGEGHVLHQDNARDRLILQRVPHRHARRDPRRRRLRRARARLGHVCRLPRPRAARDQRYCQEAYGPFPREWACCSRHAAADEPLAIRCPATAHSWPWRVPLSFCLLNTNFG